jgi:hypothetical protein
MLVSLLSMLKENMKHEVSEMKSREACVCDYRDSFPLRERERERNTHTSDVTLVSFF